MRKLRALRLVPVAAAFMLLAVGIPAAQSAPGDLDPSFGAGGLVTTDFGGRGDFGLAVAIQADGKIVAAGNSSSFGPFTLDFALARYAPDGSLDPTFGSGGTVLTGCSAICAAADVVVQPDGKIVAVGFAGSDFAVVRYAANGTLDPTFGSGGLVTTDFGGFDQGNGVALQPDGKIVAAGPLSGSIGLARYNPDGTLDSSFGSAGKVSTDASPSFDGAFDVAISGGGKIVVGGSSGLYPFSSSDFQLVRYNPDGTLDSSFGSSGIVTTDFGASDVVFGIAVTPDAKITAAGGTKESSSSPGDIAIARYNPDGSLDSTFGTAGKVTTDFSSGSDDTASGMVLQPDGHVTVATLTSSAPGSSAFGVVRYTASGALDTAFGTGGKATASFGNPINNPWDIAAQTDGKLVVVGGTADYSRGVSDFAVARFLGSTTTITVVIDVKPGSTDNVVPLQSNGVIAVAILTTAAFDATTVDPASVCFGSASDPSKRDCTEKHGAGHLEDVNADGRTDLLLHYETVETGIAAGDTQACLTGWTYAGVAVQSCDTISAR